MNKEKLSAFCHFYIFLPFPKIFLGHGGHGPRLPLFEMRPGFDVSSHHQRVLRPLAKSNFGVVNHGKPKNHHYISIPNTFKTFNNIQNINLRHRSELGGFFLFMLCSQCHQQDPWDTPGPCLGKLPPSGDVRRAESTRSPALPSSASLHGPKGLVMEKAAGDWNHGLEL